MFLGYPVFLSMFAHPVFTTFLSGHFANSFKPDNDNKPTDSADALDKVSDQADVNFSSNDIYLIRTVGDLNRLQTLIKKK